MRRCGNPPKFIEENGVVLGICLPADYCAEHEWGVSDLKSLFGIKDYESVEGPCGIERRQATLVPNKDKKAKGQGFRRLADEDFLYEERGSIAGLAIGHHIWRTKPEDENKNLFDQLPSELEHKPKSKDEEFLAGAWDGGSFCVLAKGENNINNLKKVRDAIDSKNVFIMMGGGGLFDNPGLVIGFVDVLPADKAQMLKEGDEDKQNLYKAALETGIEKKICENLKNSHGGKPFYGLSPSWFHGKGKKISKYKVWFWLNPQDQEKNNYGMVTVEDLEQWIEGKGPIPNRKKGRGDCIQ